MYISMYIKWKDTEAAAVASRVCHIYARVAIFTQLYASAPFSGTNIANCRALRGRHAPVSHVFTSELYISRDSGLLVHGRTRILGSMYMQRAIDIEREHSMKSNSIHERQRERYTWIGIHELEMQTRVLRIYRRAQQQHTRLLIKTPAREMLALRCSYMYRGDADIYVYTSVYIRV